MVSDRDLRAALALFDGWTYAPAVRGQRRCFYPAQSRVRALYLPQAGPLHTDCCCYVEGVVLAAAGLDGPQWGRARHRRAVVAAPEQAEALRWLQRHVTPRDFGDVAHQAHVERLYGLPDELSAVGLADVVVDTFGQLPRPVPGEWWVGQLWERDWSSGHAVLVEGRAEGVAIHEASQSAGRVITRAVTTWPLGSHYWQRWARLRVE